MTGSARGRSRTTPRVAEVPELTPRSRRRRPFLALVVVAVMASSLAGCAVRRYTVPTGPWQPATDASVAWQEATADCAGLLALRASVRLSGRVGPQAIPGFRSATLGVAVTAADQVGLEARHSGQLLFRLGGTADRTVLFWSEGPRTLTAPAADLVDALIGVKVTPRRLLAILAGCAGTGGPVDRAERSGGDLRVTTPDAVVYLSRVAGAWRVRAARLEGMYVSYDLSRGRAAPAAVRIDSLPEASLVVALSLRLVDVEHNPEPALPPAAFAVNVPPEALPMTLDELRSWRSGGELR